MACLSCRFQGHQGFVLRFLGGELGTEMFNGPAHPKS